jgi:hypothetical protein
MRRDDDLSPLLPRPPLPAPARREAAIGEALRRFDGGGERPAGQPATAPRPAASSWWPRINRPVAGTLAGACVAALIALPLAWMTMGDPPAPDAPADSAAPPKVAAANSALAPADEGPATYADAGVRTRSPTLPGPQPQPQPPRAPETRPALPPAAPARGREPVPEVGETELAAAAEADSGTVVVTGSRIRRRDLESASPLTIVAPDEAPAGRGAPTAAAAIRGDWNACTVDDPARNLAACRASVDPAAPGARGRAAAHIADGLAQAWRGEQAGAIASFDRALALDSRSASALLNRGLAWRSRGDFTRALADLDRAVRQDPRGARGYYHRALLLRQRGDTARARADEDRAIRLDPRYAALLGGSC